MRTTTASLMTLACVTLFGACVACATEPPSEPSRNPAARFYGYDINGLTVWRCDRGRPVSFIRDGMSRLDERATRAHERSHAALARSFATCTAYQAWRTDPENNLTMEALAFCASVRQRVKDGAVWDDALTTAARLLSERYTVNATPERARQRIEAVCP